MKEDLDEDHYIADLRITMDATLKGVGSRTQIIGDRIKAHCLSREGLYVLVEGKQLMIRTQRMIDREVLLFRLRGFLP